MGLYGSPQLWPPDNKENQNYTYGYGVNQYLPSRHASGGCLKNLLIFLGALSVFATLFVVVGQWNESATAVNTPRNSINTNISAPRHYGYSNEGMMKWAKKDVTRSLIHPDTAQFSANDFDWKFSKEGNIYSAISFVVCCSNDGVDNSRIPFEVRYYYVDGEPTTDIIYLKLGDKIVYKKAE